MSIATSFYITRHMCSQHVQKHVENRRNPRNNVEEVIRVLAKNHTNHETLIATSKKTRNHTESPDPESQELLLRS